MAAEPIFFSSPDEFREWLAANHNKANEVYVGFHKVATGKPSMTWAQSVDQALCFGWIDGVRKGLGADSYMIRFTPRKAGSNWSAVNVRRVAELTTQGLIQPPGLAAFEARKDDKTAIYSYEQRHKAAFDTEQQAQFEANAAAWDYFQAQPLGYRNSATYWVVSAKRADTRQRRLAQLIEDSANSKRLGNLA
jgi:uncharacterized protein YdeI (YjbR/CyaY-like superfamily)